MAILEAIPMLVPKWGWLKAPLTRNATREQTAPSARIQLVARIPLAPATNAHAKPIHAPGRRTRDRKRRSSACRRGHERLTIVELSDEGTERGARPRPLIAANCQVGDTC
jgi:hypothetical protein